MIDDVIKLNLGCGDKLYNKDESWVNVDIVEPPKAKKHKCYNLHNVGVGTAFDAIEEPILFHQSDLRDLLWIDNECADEVHAYHVIEHFYRSEVPEVLKEWFRVLKSGGKIVLEQPDVLKCAANILLGVTRREPVLVNQMGILGFFGAGSSTEPYMSHKWGWFPDSLKEQLENAGFVNISLDKAQTHMGDARDFRIVGEKP